jgi:hypothetical protein
VLVRGDESLRLGRHDDGDAGPELDQLADDVRDLVRRDPAADRDDNLAAAEREIRRVWALGNRLAIGHGC